MKEPRSRATAVRPSDELLTRTFVELTEGLVGDVDVVPFLQMLSTRCVELFDLKSAGVMVQAPTTHCGSWRPRTSRH